MNGPGAERKDLSMDIVQQTDGGAMAAVGGSRSSGLPTATKRCGDCDHGLIFARNANGTVKAWFTCGECCGSGRVLVDGRAA